MSELLKNTEFARFWNSEKNRDIDLDIITIGSNRKVWWLCENGHTWEAKIDNRNKGTKCPLCTKNPHNKR